MKTRKTVLITGAAGNIGQKLKAHLETQHNDYLIKSTDKVLSGDSSIIVLDLSIWSPEIVETLKDVDVVIHLAADPDETKTWEQLIASNLDAVVNLYNAAGLARVPKVIFASSNHVMGGYRNEKGIGRWLTTNQRVKPGTQITKPGEGIYDSTAYGAFKLVGERLGLSFALTTDAVCIAIRLGWVNRLGGNQPEDLPKEADVWLKNTWLSTADMCQLFAKAIDIEKPAGTFLVVNGISNNANMVWDIEQAKAEIGYEPVDGLKRN